MWIGRENVMNRRTLCWWRLLFHFCLQAERIDTETTSFRWDVSVTSRTNKQTNKNDNGTRSTGETATGLVWTRRFCRVFFFSKFEEWTRTTNSRWMSAVTRQTHRNVRNELAIRRCSLLIFLFSQFNENCLNIGIKNGVLLLKFLLDLCSMNSN